MVPKHYVRLPGENYVDTRPCHPAVAADTKIQGFTRASSSSIAAGGKGGGAMSMGGGKGGGGQLYNMLHQTPGPHGPRERLANFGQVVLGLDPKTGKYKPLADLSSAEDALLLKIGPWDTTGYTYSRAKTPASLFLEIALKRHLI